MAEPAEARTDEDWTRRGWASAALLAVAWGLLPVLPPLLRGEIPGSPWTDLYPSVWGLQWFASNLDQGLPVFAPELAAPVGMPFYYSSPLHGWLAAPLLPLIGLPLTYAALLVAARVATVLCAYGAGKAFGLSPGAALLPAAIYGCAPFFHGYAVEGIVEGTDGWTLALFLWMAGRGRLVAAALAAALVVLSSWYMAMVGVLVAAALLPWRWRATVAFATGLALASPALLAFFGAFPANAPLDPTVRAAMGTALELFPRPGLLDGLNPFAKTSWLGWIAPLLALLAAPRHPWLAAGAVAAWILSLGVGPVYELPVWRSVRFPYRLHAATLIATGLLAGYAVDEVLRPALRRWSWTPGRVRAVPPLIAALVVIEGLLLSPIEPVLPGAPAEVPEPYRALAGKVVLSVPGPLAMPPGEINRSRPRARYVLYWAAVADTRAPWAPDFNAVGTVAEEAAVLDAVRSWDPLTRREPVRFSAADLRAAGIDAMVVHKDELGSRRSAELRQAFVEHVLHEDGSLVVLGGW